MSIHHDVILAALDRETAREESLATKLMHNIAVARIFEQAGVDRQTFQDYLEAKDDAGKLAQMDARAVAIIEVEMSSEENAEPYIQKVLSETRELIRTLEPEDAAMMTHLAKLYETPGEQKGEASSAAEAMAVMALQAYDEPEYLAAVRLEYKKAFPQGNPDLPGGGKKSGGLGRA